MMTLTNNELKKSDLLRAICNELQLEDYCVAGNIKELNIDSYRCTGAIDYYAHADAFTSIILDLNLHEDLQIAIPSHNSKMLYLLYVTDGNLYHQLKSSTEVFKIEPFKTVALAPHLLDNHLLTFRRGSQLKCNLISVNYTQLLNYFEIKDNLESHDFNGLIDIIEKMGSELFECGFNLKIAKQLKIIETHRSMPTLSSNLMREGRMSIILSIYLDQLTTHIKGDSNEYEITGGEIKKIKAVSDYIVENPGLNHAQSKLCSKFYISQSKLQFGFKIVHKTTVSNFTRQIRLKKSEFLLNNSDLNISEIVYTVGFTSRSYFSKIFKEKYGCNPTAYRQNFKNSKLEEESKR
ncbi:MAG: AraC family transcriptional regulator [Psychroserpens sp.]|uniref:helix-turn-helix domain-containing protein n=1 Tax=Psychroserpens sp. TaxID=2020870 RepID=UPI003CA4C83D